MPPRNCLLPEADADLASLADATLSDSIFGFQFLAGVDHAVNIRPDGAGALMASCCYGRLA